MRPLRPSRLPAPVRIASAQRKEDAFAEAGWVQLPRLVSLSDLGVNDFRYSLYRSKVQLTAGQAAKERFLLFNMYTRDIVSVQVNGKRPNVCFPIVPMRSHGPPAIVSTGYVRMNMTTVSVCPVC